MILTRVAHPQCSVFRGFNERSDRGGKGRLRGIAGTVLALRISPARMKGETHRFWEYAGLSGNSHADRRSELGEVQENRHFGNFDSLQSELADKWDEVVVLSDRVDTCTISPSDNGFSQ